MLLLEIIKNKLQNTNKNPEPQTEQQNSNTNIIDLPPELILLILFNCSPHVILNLQKVCKLFKQVAQDDYLWRGKVKRHFSCEFNNLASLCTPDQFVRISWEKVFKKLYNKRKDSVRFPIQSHLIYLIHENDLTEIKKIKIHLDHLRITSISNLNSSILTEAPQAILDYFYFQVVCNHIAQNDYDLFGWTRLHWAVCCNQLTEFKKIIEPLIIQSTGKLLNSSKLPATICIAAENGRLEMLKLLLEKGAQVDLIDYLDTPLNLAAKNGFSDVVELLLKYGADINHSGSLQETPLIKAIKNHHFSTVKTLIFYNVTINQPPYYGTALMQAIKINNHKVVELLLQNGADVNQTGGLDGETPLCLAAERADAEIIKLLLAYGAIIDKPSITFGLTPLWIVSRNGYITLVEMFISHGADVNKTSLNGITPLWIAAYHGYTKIINTLLLHKADVNLANDHGETPIWCAAQRGHRAAVELLLISGADVNKADNRNITAMQIAITHGEYKIVALLRSYDLIIKCISNTLTDYDDFNCIKVISWDFIDNLFLCLRNRYAEYDIERAQQLIRLIKRYLCSPIDQLPYFNKTYFASNNNLRQLSLCFIAISNSTDDDKHIKQKIIRSHTFKYFKDSLLDSSPDKKIERLRFARMQPIFCQHRSTFFKLQYTHTVNEIDKMIEQEVKQINDHGISGATSLSPG